MDIDRILCDELLEEVLRRIPFRSLVSADVSLVSKRWLRLYRSSKSNLHLHLSPDNCKPPSLSSFLSHFPRLDCLLVTIVGGDDDVSNFPDQILLSVASSCPKLALLHFKSEPVSLFPLISLSTSCPQLISLRIAQARPFSFHWLVFLHSLKDLTIVFTPVPGEVEQVDALRRNFNVALKLETLVLDGIQRHDFGFDSLWKSCKNLKTLRLYRCDGIGDDTSASSFVDCFNGLQEVELQWCGSIVNDILMSLVENCTSLNSLLIYHGGSGVDLYHFIAHSRSDLRKLHLLLPLDLENNHLLAVAEKFRGLLSLRLNSCILVTGEGLKTMVLAMSSKLEELALINCRVEHGLLATLGQRFRNLRKLDLSFNEMLVEKEFISMLESFNCLRGLKVRGCEGLTNASVVSMSKSCKQLEFVDIMKCPGIGAEAVELLVFNCLQLRLIYVEESKLSDGSRWMQDLKKSPDAAGFESSLTFVPSSMISDDGKYCSSYGHQITSLLFH
ncbi:hypothetical protein Vadar_022397 [Vaccinium darrowii]|uniref:Uncharacterized protein n=1 Tax=Vaccinium darrowii TaxID=229202 RepID=A0ACB7YFM6_9ERIC|nr:hypothetical protein Vadar_022397 [Vaccinium darrowii]